MKRKHGLVKSLLVILVFVAAGLIYSCSRTKAEQNESSALITDVSGDIHEGIIDPETASREEGSTDAVMPTEPATTQVRLICVFVCGQVMRPGVYYITEGSRIHEVIDLAGGLTENAAFEYVNLAEYLTDGVEIYIPSVSEIEEMSGGGTAAFPGSGSPAFTAGEGIYTYRGKSADDGKIDINTASQDELMTLPGIGQSKAEAIISYRENVALFETTEDIQRVSGIKDSTYSKIKDYIKVQ